MLDSLFARWFGDTQSRRFGQGWIGGVLGVFLGVCGLLAVLCLSFPDRLTSPMLRELYPMPLVRTAIAGVIVLAFVCASISLALRRRKVLGVTGLALVLLASLLGGSGVPVDGPVGAPLWLGVDWFLLNVLLMAAVLVPLERGFPLRSEQRVFRPEWTLDLAWFLASHVAVQALSLAIVAPAGHLAERLHVPALRAVIAELPFVVAFPLAVLAADLAQYWVHRAFHAVPWLWRFHRVHHSTTTMDWLAGSRLHFVDVVATRGAVLAALLTLGFAPIVLGAYLAFVAAQAVFVHANFGPRLRWLEPWLVTPRFHHWHHAADEAAIDTNFAVHLPWLDRLFGTHHLPAVAWPERYGLVGETAPSSWWGQLLWPFRR